MSRAEDILLEGATVHTVSGETLSPCDVLIVEGKISQIGGNIILKEKEGHTTVINLKGLHLYPGLIAATTSLGLVEIGAVRATQDTNEVGEYTPDVQAAIAVNPDSELIPVARANGITHALALPMGGIVPGQSGLIAMTGWTWEQMTVKSPVAMHLFWPGMDLNTTPQEEWKGKSEWKSPDKQAEERRAKLKQIDDFFEEAKAYAKARDVARSGGAGGIPDSKMNPAWEAMIPLIKGEIPLMIHADEFRQIKSALTWAESKGFPKIILAGGRDADRVTDLLVKLKVPVIYERTFENPVRDIEAYDVHFSVAKHLHDAGVKVAFSPGAGSWAAADARNLPYHAAQSMAFGLPRDEALKGITLYPAQILGVADRLGSIEVGKEASLIAVTGDILDIRSTVQRMWIAGAEVSLESRHTRLNEKYKNRPKGK